MTKKVSLSDQSPGVAGSAAMFLGGLFDGVCEDVFHENSVWINCIFHKDCGKFKKGDKVRYISFHHFEGALYVTIDKDDKEGTKIELV